MQTGVFVCPHIGSRPAIGCYNPFRICGLGSSSVAAGDPANEGDKLSRHVLLGPGPGLAGHGAQPIRNGLPSGYSSRRALRALLAVIV